MHALKTQGIKLNMNDSYQKFYAARMANAMKMARANRADDCLATKLANEFLGDGNNWRTLPMRLRKLASFVGDESDEAQRLITATVFVRAPESFYDDFEQLFESLLNAHQKKWAVNNAEDSMEVDDTDLLNEDDERLLSEEISLYASLNTLGWIKKKLHRPFRAALNKVTMRVISEIAAHNWEEEGVYHRAMEWKSSVLEPWVTSVVGVSAFAERRYDAQLEYSCSEAFIMVRMGELFELVTEWPESLPAVKELRVALDRTGRLWYQSLAKKWRHSLRARLLHPGAETSQIIDVYINIIKVLREMDPSGELLEVVSQPVREYLKGREDTIRCIVTSLTDEENGGELYEELKRQDAKPLDDAQLLDEEDDETQPSFDWMPPPSILNRRGVISGQIGTITSVSRRSGDTLSMLVGIYGSKDLFVNEYRNMLADKLLNNLDYNTDKEVHNLELLKLRFGDLSLRTAEVMIKDIDESKRIHSNVRSTFQSRYQHNEVDAAIISHIFWPKLSNEEYKYHPSLQEKIDRFSTEFRKLKNPRKLVWMKQLGTVDLEVEAYENDPEGKLVSSIKSVTCSPVHASLLANFEDKSDWTSEELSTQMGMPEEAIRKRMTFWINQRVLKSHQDESGLRYSLVSACEAEPNDGDTYEEDDHQGQISYAGTNHNQDATDAFESYICGMLSNLGSLRLNRIHSMLKSFVAGSDHQYDKTPQQLAIFLQELCKRNVLECSPDGTYSLVKTS